MNFHKSGMYIISNQIKKKTVSAREAPSNDPQPQEIYLNSNWEAPKVKSLNLK